MGGKNNVNDKILVTYATLTGSTAEVAQAIGQRLRDAGADVDVLPAKQVVDVSPYSAAVVGSGVRWIKPYSEALTFLEEQQEALSDIPTAYFIVCGAMQKDTEENRHRAWSYIDALRASAPHVHPVAMELFGGRADSKELPRLLQLILKLIKKQAGDFRNWDTIRSWAEDLGDVLLDGATNRDTIASVRADLAGPPDPGTTRRHAQVPG